MSWTIPCPRDRERKSERSVNVPCGSDLRWRFVCWRRRAASVCDGKCAPTKRTPRSNAGPISDRIVRGWGVVAIPSDYLFVLSTNERSLPTFGSGHFSKCKKNVGGRVRNPMVRRRIIFICSRSGGTRPPRKEQERRSGRPPLGSERFFLRAPVSCLFASCPAYRRGCAVRIGFAGFHGRLLELHGWRPKLDRSGLENR
jgi:hypothetical protein